MMNILKDKINRILLALMVLFALCSYAYSQPNIISMTLDPQNPSFGQHVTITLTYCSDLYQDTKLAIAVSDEPAPMPISWDHNGQIFVVSSSGVDVPVINPAGVAVADIGYPANTMTPYAASDCQLCVSGNGKTITRNYVIRIPERNNFQSCNINNLYIHAAVDGSALLSEDWPITAACMRGFVTIPVNDPGTSFGQNACSWPAVSDIGIYTTVPPDGWVYQAQGTETAAWEVYNDCYAGSPVIKGDAPNGYWPALLKDEPFWNGSVQCDFKIAPNGFPGADLAIVLRSNGENLDGINAKLYSLHATVDTNPGAGYLSIEKINNSLPSWHAGTSAVALTGNKWYTAKAIIAGANIKAKVWAKGEPEPANWAIDWTDPDPIAKGNETWRAGIREMSDDSGDVWDYYSGFCAVNAIETPTEAPTLMPTETATLTAAITPYQTIINTPTSTVTCPCLSPTVTSTPTNTPYQVSTSTPTLTVTCPCLSPTVTSTPSNTPYQVITNTPTSTLTCPCLSPTVTSTPTNTPYQAITNTPTFTYTYQINETATATMTEILSAATATVTSTPYAFRTATPVNTCSCPVVMPGRTPVSQPIVLPHENPYRGHGRLRCTIVSETDIYKVQFRLYSGGFRLIRSHEEVLNAPAGSYPMDIPDYVMASLGNGNYVYQVILQTRDGRTIKSKVGTFMIIKQK